MVIPAVQNWKEINRRVLQNHFMILHKYCMQLHNLYQSVTQ